MSDDHLLTLNRSTNMELDSDLSLIAHELDEIMDPTDSYLVSDLETSSSDDGEDELIAFESDQEEISQENSSSVLLDARARNRHALEIIALSFLQQVASDKVELALVSRTKAAQEDGTISNRTMLWPTRRKKGSLRRFACLFRVIDLICEALEKDIPTTKREIFYQDVPLFNTQSVVNDLVDDLAATIGATRADLNVRASAKGLFCGSGLKLHLRRGGIVYGNDADGALIPAGADISHIEVDSKVSWVLIVEKEAIFQTLCQVNFGSNPLCPGAGIIVTGKGYPDVATRELVCRLSHSVSASIPILALVDGDAHGLEILSVYKYGSLKLRHEGSKIITPRIKWLGVCSSELAGLGIDRDKLIPLTKHDHKKALDMLRRDVIPIQWKRELSHMLHSRRKAEIEIISSVSRFTTQHSSRTSQKPSSSLQTMFQGQDEPLGDPPLIQYLISKLHFWINSQ